MKKLVEFISHIYSLILKSEYQRAWNIIYLHILKKYFKAWYLIFRKYPTPTDLQTIKKDPILIYQMGKVGSRSVLFSLEITYLKYNLPNVGIHHVHAFQDLETQEKVFRQTQPHNLHIVEGYKRLKHQLDNDSQQHWNVISLVRDPVARSVGAFFENVNYYFPNWKELWKSKSLSIENLINIFLNTKVVHTGHLWFDSELKPSLGIDIYESPFSTENGYQIYSKPSKINLLLIRLEDLNQVGNTAIGNFLGIPDFSLYQSNVGEEKEYAEIYNAFKSMPLPLDYINKTYATKYARHFYTDEERDLFTKKWSKNNRFIA